LGDARFQRNLNLLEADHDVLDEGLDRIGTDLIRVPKRVPFDPRQVRQLSEKNTACCSDPVASQGAGIDPRGASGSTQYRQKCQTLDPFSGLALQIRKGNR
jgi:hypothetical protein